MNIYKVIISSFLLFFLFSCNTVSVTTDYDRQVNFTEYKTFAFHQGGLDQLKMNDLDKRRVTSAIKTNLESKGLTQGTESSANLLINISASSRNKVDVDQSFNPWWGYGPGWGMGPQYRVREYKEGTLVIDLVDRNSNTLVWQGAGEGLNVSDISRKAEAIPVAIDEILEDYPPNRK